MSDADATQKKMNSIADKQAEAGDLHTKLDLSLAMQRLVPDVFEVGEFAARSRWVQHGRKPVPRRSDFTFVVTRADGTETSFAGEDVPDIFWEKSDHDDIRNAFDPKGEREKKEARKREGEAIQRERGW